MCNNQHDPHNNTHADLIELIVFRQESLRQAEKERRKKYKAQDDEREVVRANIREKVLNLYWFSYFEIFLQYKIEAPLNEEDFEDDEEDDDGFGGSKKKEDDEEKTP